jgi:Rad3-related DNA helicase
MKAESALLDAYTEWRRLAAAASYAIRSRNWAFVQECHGVIEQLQPRITQLTREAAGEWHQSGMDCPDGREKIRLAVLELNKLVESNKSMINSVRERISSEYQERQQAGRNLKRLQKSYAMVHRQTWSSFS